MSCTNSLKVLKQQNNYIIYSFFVTDSEPQKPVLLEFLCSVSSKWYVIGALLGVDDNTLDGLLAKDYDDQMKLSKTLKNWLENRPTPTTWRKIIKIMEGSLQKKSLAMDIRQYLIKGGTIISNPLILCRGFYV